MTKIYSDLWFKHFTAHNDLDLDGVVATYSKNALLEVYDRESGKLQVFRGHAEIKVYFKHHLKCLTNADGKIAEVDVMKPGGVQPDGNSLYVPWGAKSDSTEFKDCADTFVFEPVEGNSALISHHYQFIREIPLTTIYSDLWDKRLEAYGASNLDNFVATYSKNALLEVYDRQTGKVQVFRGHSEIKVYFEHHFKCLTNSNGDKAPFSSPYNNNTIKPGGIQTNGNTLFFPWEAKSDNTEFKNCAETFVFEPVDEGESALVSHHYQFIEEIPLNK